MKIYLYLASRSKKGIKLVTTLEGSVTPPSRLNDVHSLKLPSLYERKIKELIEENKMLYEPYIESARNFNELRQKLHDRGYSNIPTGATMMLNMPNQHSAPKVETSNFQVRKTMIKRKY